MVDHSELKRLAEACGNLNWRFQQENWTEYAIRDDHGYIATMRVGSPKQAGPDPDREAKAKFLGAMTPAAVLGLIADLDEARNGMKHSCAIRLKKQIEHLETERDQLKAEIAGLKTGFEAYEQVNTGLRVENETLVTAAQAIRDEWRKDQADAERYRWLRDQCGIVEYKAIAGSIGSGMLPSGENLDAALSDAMGEGEQS